MLPGVLMHADRPYTYDVVPRKHLRKPSLEHTLAQLRSPLLAHVERRTPARWAAHVQVDAFLRGNLAHQTEQQRFGGAPPHRKHAAMRTPHTARRTVQPLPQEAISRQVVSGVSITEPAPLMRGAGVDSPTASPFASSTIISIPNSLLAMLV